MSPIDTNHRYVWVDRIAFFVLFGIYCILHIAAIIWRYEVPLGYRREMKRKDMEYEHETEIKTSGANTMHDF